MNAFPKHFIDRWKQRQDIPIGQGMVYWHVLLGKYPEVQGLATITQERLSAFAGLHMTPLQWLHITVLIAGSANEITSDDMMRMISEAEESLSNVPPIDISLGRVHFHPEAILLKVQPGDALMPILEAAQSATFKIVGKNDSFAVSPSSWKPHVTLCYSTEQQPADPIIAALGEKLPQTQVRVDALSLVIQHGPERLWDWRPFGTVSLQKPRGT